ncbi:MAG: HD domain-containing protein [Lachnospiraceae bacterium]|nr:HD domain-containing protein [Lachnospiraceae bacterium]MBQ4068030.1 HD domain-containing protein [Lachnospiraceae bacterium]
MLCLRPDELKQGMIIARPIYNKQGVLLYDRNTKLTRQSVQSIKNFGLLAVFILEPTEPVPDITDEERMFERFQTMAMFALKDELDGLSNGKGLKNIENLAAKIIKMYGGLEHKMNFIGSLRSAEDYVYKHSLNVAIISAVIAHHMKMKHTEQMDVVIAALLHETGKAMLPKSIIAKKEDDLTEEDKFMIKKYEIDGNELIQQDNNISASVKAIINQNFKELAGKSGSNPRFLEGTRVLRIADVFDTMTEVGVNHETFSKVAVIKYFLSELDFYGEKGVGALIKGINILNPGVCVELTNGVRALVIKENEENLLRPILLDLDNNVVYDLNRDDLYNKVQIKDVLKTMDKRVKLSDDFVNRFLESINNRKQD